MSCAMLSAACTSAMPVIVVASAPGPSCGPVQRSLIGFRAGMKSTARSGWLSWATRTSVPPGASSPVK